MPNLHHSAPAVLFALLCSATAQAQYYGTQIDVNTNLNMMLLQQQDLGNMAGAHEVVQATKRLRHDEDDATRPEVNDFSYLPTAAISEAMEQRFLDNLRKTDESMARSAKNDLADRDMIERFEADVGPYGLRSDDVADVMTAYWVVTWMAANQTDLPKKGEVQAVRAQVRQQLADNEKLRSAGNDTHQQLAEAYIYETMWTITLRSNANSKAERQQLASATQAQALKMGLDMSRMELRSDGFVRR